MLETPLYCQLVKKAVKQRGTIIFYNLDVAVIMIDCKKLLATFDDRKTRGDLKLVICYLNMVIEIWKPILFTQCDDVVLRGYKCIQCVYCGKMLVSIKLISYQIK